MNSLMMNVGIFTKANASKYLLLFSSNVLSLINFGLNLLIFFTYVSIDYLELSFCFSGVGPIVFISNFRQMNLNSTISVLQFHLLVSIFALIAFDIGEYMYKIPDQLPTGAGKDYAACRPLQF